MIEPRFFVPFVGPDDPSMEKEISVLLNIETTHVRAQLSTYTTGQVNLKAWLTLREVQELTTELLSFLEKIEAPIPQEK